MHHLHNSMTVQFMLNLLLRIELHESRHFSHKGYHGLTQQFLASRLLFYYCLVCFLKREHKNTPLLASSSTRQCPSIYFFIKFFTLCSKLTIHRHGLDLILFFVDSLLVYLHCTQQLNITDITSRHKN